VSSADPATTCFAVQLLVGAILLIGEATGRLRLPYGKFRTGAGSIREPDWHSLMQLRYSSISCSGLKVVRREHCIT
jgi:hypothetical protein